MGRRIVTDGSEQRRRVGAVRLVQPVRKGICEELRRAGAAFVIVTLGAKGALIDGPGGSQFIPAPSVDARDSTAAGDAFNGGLALALARKTAVVDAVREASLVGALSVTRLGAQPSLPSEDELKAFVESIGRS